MNLLICAGGSGARVLEAIVHLCAVGLGPNELSILLIDPDVSNGNAERTQNLLQSYDKCHSKFGERLGVDHSGKDLNLFGTKLHVARTWSPILDGQKTLNDLLGYHRLSPADQAITRLLFTKAERETKLNQGFRGHPTIGAAVMSLVSQATQNGSWAQIVNDLTVALSDPTGARAFLVGSVFGGTGASAIHPIARFLRDVSAQVRAPAARLRIGVAALVPYFTFSEAPVPADADAGLTAKADQFPLATRSAVEFYQHLRTHNDWPFDAMYWIGDSSPTRLEKHALGGPQQENPAHFVELLSAIASIDFFRAPSVTGACYYCGLGELASPQQEHANILRWLDLPLDGRGDDKVQERFLRFFVLGLVHLRFCNELLQDPRIERYPWCVPWYLKRFVAKQDRMEDSQNRESLDVLTKYFQDYHFPWWLQIHEHGGVRLFAKGAIPHSKEGRELAHLAALLPAQPGGEVQSDQIDEFVNDMARVKHAEIGENAGKTYLALLAHAADVYIKRTYSIT